MLAMTDYVKLLEVLELSYWLLICVSRIVKRKSCVVKGEEVRRCVGVEEMGKEGVNFVVSSDNN